MSGHRGVDHMCFSGSGLRTHPHFEMNCLLLRLHPTWHWQKSNIIAGFTFCSMVIRTRIELLLGLLTRLVSVNVVLWQQNLKFSFHQQTVEFGPTHIFTQIYAPAWPRWSGTTHPTPFSPRISAIPMNWPNWGWGHVPRHGYATAVKRLCLWLCVCLSDCVYRWSSWDVDL